MINTVCSGATLGCTMGVGTRRLNVVLNGVMDDKRKALATILDCVPHLNIPPFAGCRSPGNPSSRPPGQKPCHPAFPAPWTTLLPTLFVARAPALLSSSVVSCALGGQVFVIDPACFVVALPFPGLLG